MDRIAVSENHRFLVTETGEPFFWLADTAWELFHRLNKQEAEFYLETRRRQGFSVIQAVALAEVDGIRVPNANGHTPLLGDDPTRPDEFYFRDVDTVIRLAAEKELYIALLPTWGDKVNGNLWGAGPVIFNEENAYTYGKFLGTRYCNDANILWVLGGDRPAEGYEDIWAAMAKGIIDGCGFRPFFTYHPSGGSSSSKWLHDADWLDMNMMQSGHVLFDTPNWDWVKQDYDRIPSKPVLDGEPNYEDHPVDIFTRKWDPSMGRYTAYDVRKQAYRAVFSGACGHTYGNHSIWQFWALDRQPVNRPMPTWDEAVFAPGAGQLMHLKNLMLSRPYLSRVPDQSLLPREPAANEAGSPEKDRFNPLRAAHPTATRGQDGSYAFVYIPQANQTVEVDLSKLASQLTAYWYDPHSGQSYPIGSFHNQGLVAFTTPIAGPDWVLVLDDAFAKFDLPGVLS